MSAKAWEGIAEIGSAIAVFAVAPYLGPAALAFVTSTAGSTLIAGIGVMGVGQEISAIADAIKGGPSTGVMTKQAAQPRRVIYGVQRVSPTLVFLSTTGSKDRLNQIACWCSHPIDNLIALYLDGKQVHFAANGFNGTDGTWGQGDGNTYTSEAGNQYSFGSGVYAEHRFGDVSNTRRDKSGVAGPAWMSSLTGNDSHWTNTCQLNGIAYTYLKLDYDADAFPSGQPQVKATISGKNDILDPRTGTKGFTSNAALCIADFLCNKDWGMRVSWSELDLDELIASANVCDEQIALVNGGSEPRYSINGSFTTDTSPSDTLSSMLQACDGRVAYVGGKYRIIVGYDRGVSVAFDESDFSGSLSFSPLRSERGRFNSVMGTFICPRYPYVTAGNYYNQDRPVQGTFDGAWQPTNAPQFDLSAARGYPVYPLVDEDGNAILDDTGAQESGDVYMAADNGQRLYAEVKQQFVTSVSQWQRLAKIKLMRHRQEMTATLPLRLSGLKVCAGDYVLVSFADQGWIDKEFEVTDFSFVSKEENGILKLETELKVTETDPVALYAWDASDELALNAVDYVTGYDAQQITAPTSLTLTSTGVTTSDGIFQPRILVAWAMPDDGMIVAYRVEISFAGANVFNVAATVNASESSVPIGGVTQGQAYDVRVCSMRQNGVESVWLTGTITVGSAQSVIATLALSPNAPSNVYNTATIDSIVEGSAATVRVYGPGGDGSAWTYYAGSSSASKPSAHITGLLEATAYYICFNVSTSTFVATQSYAATLNDSYLYIGELTTASAGTTTTGGTTTGGSTGTKGGGGRTAPSLE